MDQQQNQNDELIKKLKEANFRLQSIQTSLVWIVITTGVVALAIILAYFKISSFSNQEF